MMGWCTKKGEQLNLKSLLLENIITNYTQISLDSFINKFYTKDF